MFFDEVLGGEPLRCLFVLIPVPVQIEEQMSSSVIDSL